MAISDYEQCLSDMYGLRRFGIILDLDAISAVLTHIGNPQKDYRIIHIAGTNGKGSVAAMLSTILKTAGYRVGRYTSPHLERFNERICINNVPIEDAAIVSAYKRILDAPTPERELTYAEAAEALARYKDQGIASPYKQLLKTPKPERGLTFFELTTAIALYAFSRKKVDWAVIETGMGGRLDATNMVTPEISIITNISLEHRDYLGNTIGAIAGEKAGIIKRDTPLVTGVTQKSALRAILDQASSLNAPTYLKGRDFNSRRSGTQQFSYYGIKDTWKRLELGLSGRHQIENATLALAACEILRNSSALELSKDDIFQGLIRTKWPGRLEVVATHPHLILDGAHNIMAARKLAQYLKENFKGRNITLIIGLLDDKPIDVILKDLIAPCNRIVVTQPVIDRAVPAKDLAEAAKKFTGSVDVVPDVGEALKRTWNNSVEEDVICVAGSLYVVGEAKTAWRKMEPAVA